MKKVMFTTAGILMFYSTVLALDSNYKLSDIKFTPPSGFSKSSVPGNCGIPSEGLVFSDKYLNQITISKDSKLLFIPRISRIESVKQIYKMSLTDIWKNREAEFKRNKNIKVINSQIIDMFKHKVGLLEIQATTGKKSVFCKSYYINTDKNA